LATARARSWRPAASIVVLVVLSDVDSAAAVVEVDPSVEEVGASVVLVVLVAAAVVDVVCSAG
jgi:hypothetical protein